MMNSCRCIACYSSPSLCYRELPYCHCETVHYSRVPQVINPIRTRPVLYKAPVATIALPQSMLMRNSERSVPQNTPRAGQTKLKFGIDSILGKDTSETVRQDHLGEYHWLSRTFHFSLFGKVITSGKLY